MSDTQTTPAAAASAPPARGPRGLLTRARLFLEMIRFSHTVFALPFALLAALMAWHERAHDVALPNLAITAYNEALRVTPILTVDGLRSAAEAPHPLGAVQEPLPAFRWRELLGILLCMVFARSTAMAVNRLADRKLDAENPRTARRHLPAGLLSVPAVACFALACAALFVASTLLFLPNRWPLLLSVPVLLFVCGYSFAKRFTALAHLWLGAALMLAPVAAWIAILGRLDWPPVVLGGAVMLWVSGFDMIYACQDVDVDRRLRLHSIPARLGVPGALRVAALLHLGTLVLLFLLPSVYPAFGWLYYAGVLAAAALLIYEHALVRPDDLARVNTAFFHCNAVLSLGLLAVGAVDLLT